MERKILQSESLLLPMSAIIETGNHIGHIDNGHQRRKAAMDFVDFVKKALLGQSPFTATQPFKESESLLEWLDDFPDWAGRGLGLGDLTILKEFDRQCALNQSRLIYIWSLDGHLSSYHRKP